MVKDFVRPEICRHRDLHPHSVRQVVTAGRMKGNVQRHHGEVQREYLHVSVRTRVIWVR